MELGLEHRRVWELSIVLWHIMEKRVNRNLCVMPMFFSFEKKKMLCVMKFIKNLHAKTMR